MTRILAFGAWDTDAGYPRPRSLLAGVRAAGFEVVEQRHVLALTGRERSRLAMRPRAWPAFLLRLAGAKKRIIRGFREALDRHRPDGVLVLYPGHLIAPWIRPHFGGPLVLDLFLSAHDTLVVDRGRFRERSVAAGLLRRLDRRACLAADMALMDTPEYVQRMAALLAVSGNHFGWIPVSDPDAPALAHAYSACSKSAQLEVLFFGTGVPLHGLQHLIGAVGRTPAARLTLIGGSAEDRRLAATLPASRLRLLPEFVSRASLQRELEACHLVAGIFSAGEKAQRVIPFKVVHALAAGRPVVTADTPAVRRALRPGVDCLVCPAASSSALAEVLSRLRSAPAVLSSVAEQARAAYDESFSERAVARRVVESFAAVGLRAPLSEPGLSPDHSCAVAPAVT